MTPRLKIYRILESFLGFIPCPRRSTSRAKVGCGPFLFVSRPRPGYFLGYMSTSFRWLHASALCFSTCPSIACSPNSNRSSSKKYLPILKQLQIYRKDLLPQWWEQTPYPGVLQCKPVPANQFCVTTSQDLNTDTLLPPDLQTPLNVTSVLTSSFVAEGSVQNCMHCHRVFLVPVCVNSSLVFPWLSWPWNWNIASQSFCRMFLQFGFTSCFFMIEFRLCNFGRKITEVTLCFSHCVLSGDAQFHFVT